MGAVKNQMIEVCEMVYGGSSITEVANTFGMSQMQVEDILNAQIAMFESMSVYNKQVVQDMKEAIYEENL